MSNTIRGAVPQKHRRREGGKAGSSKVARGSQGQAQLQGLSERSIFAEEPGTASRRGMADSAAVEPQEQAAVARERTAPGVAECQHLRQASGGKEAGSVIPVISGFLIAATRHFPARADFPASNHLLTFAKLIHSAFRPSDAGAGCDKTDDSLRSQRELGGDCVMQEINRAKQESSAQCSIKAREVIKHGLETSEIPD